MVRWRLLAVRRRAVLGFAQGGSQSDTGGSIVSSRHTIGARALAAVLSLWCDAASAAQDLSKFPDWSGQWFRTYGGNPRYDQSKPIRKQEAPLKPEYQARFARRVKDQDAAGHGRCRGSPCLPQGMPRMMSGVSPFEFLFSPSVAHMLFER